MKKVIALSLLILPAAYGGAGAESLSFEQQLAAVNRSATASAIETRQVLPQTPPPIPSLHRFHYDPESGRCFNAYGTAGLNTVSIDELSQTKDGECADLRGASLNGSNFAYPKLVNWNLRGAALQGARLFFASLVNVDLSGANASGFLMGYANVTGKVDRFTVGFDACKKGDQVSCIH